MRLFVAVEIREPIQAPLAKLLDDLEHLNVPVKWVDPKNVHLTLKFIGETPEASVARTIEILRACAAGIRPFSLEIGGAGGFPDLQRPRTIFICAVDQPPVAAELARRLNDKLVEVGAARDDRPYQNHITLGRVRAPKPLPRLANHLETLAGKSFGSMQVSEVTLIQSKLTPAGPIYAPVERVRLTG